MDYAALLTCSLSSPLPLSLPPSLPPLSLSLSLSLSPSLPPLPSFSIEEDFVTWKEELWPSICEKFGIDSSQESAMAREYQPTVHDDLPKEKVYVGEPHRLGSYQNQKPYVLLIVTYMYMYIHNGMVTCCPKLVT